MHARTIDERFDDVTRAIAEQRDFTLHCFNNLRTDMMARFAKVEARQATLELRMDKLESRMDNLERRMTTQESMLGEVLGLVRVLASRNQPH